MNSFNNVNVFVSGGAGVIGSSLVGRLHKEGARLFVGDLKPRPKEWPKDILYREGDLNSIGKEQLLDFEPDVYFHLAATFERSEETYDFWEENFHHNVQLSHHLIDCLKGSKTLKKVVFASSYLIYDPDQYLFEEPPDQPVLLSETNKVLPRNLCGMAKLLHEQELAFIQHFNKDRLSTASARIFRSYGRNSRDIISRWIRSLLRSEEIVVYCKEGAFDFILADDVAEGLIRLASSDFSGAVNLGNDHARRISDVLRILKGHFTAMKIKEKNSTIKYEASQADMNLFQTITGWAPQHKLEDAIPLIIEYEKQKFSGSSELNES